MCVILCGCVWCVYIVVCVVCSSSSNDCYSFCCSDLFATFGKAMLDVLNNQPGVMKLLNEGKQSRNQRTKTMSLWALKELKKLNTN